MNRSITLPQVDRLLLYLVARLVPAHDRDEWSRTWQSELWHLHYSARERHTPASSGLATGLVRDALWLRTESWRLAFSGTATLCLTSLLGLNLLSAFVDLAITGSRHSLHASLASQCATSLVAAVLVVFVAFATSSRRHIGQDLSGSSLHQLQRELFFVVKIAQILVLAFLLSIDVYLPVQHGHPLTAEFLQTFCMVLLALVGLRWAFRDQELRCKQCLRTLTTPERVGRPSHNLLEWNGTEMNCKDGHGLLSVPEMETSWCHAGRWIEADHR